MARNVYRYELLSVHMNDTPSNFFGSNKQRLFLNLAKGRGWQKILETAKIIFWKKSCKISVL